MSIDLMKVIKQLEAERDRIEHAITSLRALVIGEPDTRPTGRFGSMLGDAFLDDAPKRPGAGTKTGRVWQICDDLLEVGHHDEVPRLDTVMKEGIAEGLNAGTISSQYRRWRKHRSMQEEYTPTPEEIEESRLYDEAHGGEVDLD